MKGLIKLASVVKRNKTWQVRVSYKDQNGQHKVAIKGGFTTKKEANIFAAIAEVKKSSGELIVPEPQLFSDFFEDWFNTYKRQNVRDRTIATYQQAINTLKKYLPDTKIEDMTKRKYQEFLNEYGKDKAKSTVAKMNSLYHAAVRDGVYDEIIKKDFVNGTSIVFNPNNSRKIEYLSIADENKLIHYLQETRNKNFTSKYMIITALATGMRPGEVAGLRWDDINFNFGTFTLKQSWNHAKKDFEPLKNVTSYRTVRVNQWLLELLKELPTKDDPKHRVFVNQYGTIPTSGATNDVIKESLKACNINRKGFNFQSCRHTHVAFLLANGIDIYAISKRLGHRDIITTTRVYAYLIDEYKAKTDEKIIGALGSFHQIKLNNQQTI